MENNLPATITVHSHGISPALNLQKTLTTQPSPATSPNILISWDTPASELPGDNYEVALFRKNSATEVYCRIAITPSPLPAGTSAFAFNHSVIEPASNSARYAVKVNTWRGGSTIGFIIIDEIVKWSSGEPT